MECQTSPALESLHKTIHCLEDRMEAKNLSGQNEKNGVWAMPKPSSEFFIYDHIDVSKNTTKGEVDEFNVLQVDSKPASQITDHTDSCCFNAEVLAACQTTEYAKTHEKGSLSKLLNKSAPSGNLTSTPLKNQTCILEDSPKNVGSCIELHLGKNFITMEESTDDDLLDRFECFDVMTDEAYQKLEEKLKFLLESDDEEDESILGRDRDGCAYFLSETPRLFQVSDNTMPIDAAIGFCSHQSKSKEVAVRRDLATCSPSTLQAGMTLTGGQQQSKVFPVKDKETCKLPVASTAIKNEYPRIEEENTSSNHSAVDFSVVCSPGMEKGISETRSSSNLDGSSATADKRSADRGLWKNPQHVSKLRKKLIEGKTKVSEAIPTKSSKDPLKLSHSKELHTSPVCRILRERSYLDSSAQLCKEGQCISSQGKQDTVCPAKKIGLFRGQGRDVSGPRQEDKRISCVSEGNQVPKESAALVTKQRETDNVNTEPISNDLELFITEPVLGERAIFTPSSAESVSVDDETSASEKVNNMNGFQTDRAMLENSAGLSTMNGTHMSDEQKSYRHQTLLIATRDGMDSHDVLPDDPNTKSSQEGLCDILTSMARPDTQMKSGEACTQKPHAVNKAKTAHDTSRAECLSKGDFQRALESAGSKLRDDDLSMHEQLQKLLYEEEDWGYDFICASSEAKSLAAEADTAKEVRDLSIARDVGAEQHVPGHLTEDNQLVTELATAMKVHTGFNSLLKTDAACCHSPKSSMDAWLPGGTDAMCLCSATGHKKEKQSTHLLRSSLQKEKYLEDKCIETHPDHSGAMQRSTHQEGMILADHAVLSSEAESPLRLTGAPGSPLECSQEILSSLPTNRLGQLSYTEQNVHCTYGPISKQAGDTYTKESHIAQCHLRKKECTKLAELLLKEESSSNFSGKNTDQFTSEEHSSVMAVDKSAREKFQEKGTESELNARSGSNCGIYQMLRGNNSKDIQSVSGVQNYSYHIQDHNSVITTESKANREGTEDTGQDKKKIKGGKEELTFIASYKVRYITEVLLEINKNDNSMNEEQSDLEVSAGQTSPESKHVFEKAPSDTQLRVSDKNSSTAGNFRESINGLGLDFPRFPPEACKLPALNTVPASVVIRKGGSRKGQESLNASNVAGHLIICNERTQQENLCKWPKAPTTVKSVMQAEPLQLEVKEDKDIKTLKLNKDQDQRGKGERKGKTETIQCMREKQESAAHGIEEAEGEPYMRALTDPEQIHVWHESIELQDKHEKVERGSQAKGISCEKVAGETGKSDELEPEEAEVEPYMRALLTSEQIYSWQDCTDQAHPSIVPSSKQAGVTGKGLAEGRVITSTGCSRARILIDGDRESLNASAQGTGALSSALPCVSKNSHSEKQLPQVSTRPYAAEATAGGLYMFKDEKTKLQEVSKLCKLPSFHHSTEDVKHKQETVKKMVAKVQIKKPRLEAKEKVFTKSSCTKNGSKAGTDLTHKEDKREQWKVTSKRDCKVPKLLKTIQAEPFPDSSGNIKLCCQFGEIHEDSTITWTKDSKLLAQVHRSAGDDFPVSLAIVQAGKKDQGLYHCCLKNMYGKVTAEFNLTLEVLEHLSGFQEVEGLEEIEFLQLMFKEDFICDSYLSKSLHGRITTEELHFGEGVHRKAFRSKVMQGLVPVFSPGHPCVLKVHNAIVYGTRNNDELVKKNYKLALQECYVQNTAREYAKIYAAETKPLEGFGEVPEIIPVFLIHRPKNNIPYATVEEELIGEFVKYSVKDGKEINFMRRDSEAGQKCCTFQHWVYEKTSGSLLVTDMQGVGMKLTDVGIATQAKGYKGFKGNCSFSFIDQFKVLHQCNKYCEMLGLKPLQTICQKPRKSAIPKIKAQPSTSTVKKAVVSVQAAKKT